MFVPNFEEIDFLTLVLGLENCPENRHKKRFHSKTAEVRQKIFHMVIVCLKIPHYLYQATFGKDKFFPFFFPFFPFFSFQILYAFLFLNHKTSKCNFCLKLLSYKHNFVSQNFEGPLPADTPKLSPKILFFERLKLGWQFFFDIIRYLKDKYFDVVWGLPPIRVTPPKINFLNGLT